MTVKLITSSRSALLFDGFQSAVSREARAALYIRAAVRVFGACLCWFVSAAHAIATRAARVLATAHSHLDVTPQPRIASLLLGPYLSAQLVSKLRQLGKRPPRDRAASNRHCRLRGGRITFEKRLDSFERASRPRAMIELDRRRRVRLNLAPAAFSDVDRRAIRDPHADEIPTSLEIVRRGRCGRKALRRSIRRRRNAKALGRVLEIRRRRPRRARVVAVVGVPLPRITADKRRRNIQHFTMTSPNSFSAAADSPHASLLPLTAPSRAPSASRFPSPIQEVWSNRSTRPEALQPSHGCTHEGRSPRSPGGSRPSPSPSVCGSPT